MLKNDISTLAVDHCIFSIIDKAVVEENGPRVVASGSGLTITDGAERSYTDMVGAYTRPNSLGYGNEEIARAYYDQACKMHYAGTVDIVTGPMVELAQTLTELAPGALSRAFFTSGGSESVESAIKIAKHYQQGSGRKPHAYKIISRWNAYHGATAGAMSLTNHLTVAQSPDPRLPGVSFIPNPQCYRNPFGMSEEDYFTFCADYLEQQILHEGPELVAAFIGEPIMQANGAQVPSKAYWQRVRDICTKYGVLLIMDEVICGFGRTGTWFAAEHFGIEPDILTMAKAMTAGYAPMGAAMTTAEIADAIPHFRHVHTYSGHAASAAAALATIAIKKRGGLIEKALDNGVYFQSELKAALGDNPVVGQIRGLGHWHAIDFTSDRATKALPNPEMVTAIVNGIKQRGILVGAAGTSMEVAPALIATREDFDRTVSATVESINEAAARFGLAAAA
ncbi:MAG: aminotransferase class III-fold pyridoxal phosphate-dependent enzyme [Parvibaculaceae bacterium]|nr:aminotransferase class III-fold pyridoxal phosphate-dependent enzyme [Parvibaculaceae bacterium]